MKNIMKEFLQLVKEHKLLVAVIAVIGVPILYAGMFLWAFWDPYDHLADLPIAVVNEDTGTVEDGERLQLGDDLVDNLKEDPEFDFHFVSKEKAEKGLHGQDYYIVLEIPKNFSKNATTLMDNTPEKLDIIYKPNESYNFLASQIGETAMLQIEAALEEKITETYTETIFEKIDEVAEGLNEASDATKELNDGAKELEDGTDSLSSHLLTLSTKTIEFTDGVTTAADGVKEVTKGSHQLLDGMNQLNEGSSELLQASKEVESGSAQLAAGISEANAGMHELNDKTPALVAGTTEVLNGLNTLEDQLPKQLSGAIQEELTSSTEAMNQGLSELETGITAGLTDSLAPSLTNGIASKMADEMVNNQQAQTEQLAATLLENGIDEQLVQTIIANLKEQAVGKDALTGMLQEKLAPEINGAVQQTNASIKEGFGTYETEVNNRLAGASDGLEQKITSAVSPSFGQLQAGLSEINEGQKQLQSGVSQLTAGTDELQTGSSSLITGQNKYVDSMNLFHEKFNEATNGAVSLAGGTDELASGMEQLQDGSIQLGSGVVELKDGSLQLKDGMNELSDGTSKFYAEMDEAAKDANDIETNEKTYNMMANPVEVKNEKINEVPNYGTGFSPYFLSLGLFVGALLLSIVYPLREPAGIPTSGLNWFFSKFSVLFIVGLLQAIIASGFLLLVLKLEVKSVPLFILFAIITSLVFVTLIQFLVTCLDDPGRFIAIIILILQLTTSAGTFPLELIPKFLQPINKLLPMTYSVEGFKAVISSGDFSVMWHNAGILLLFALAFILLTISYFVIMFKRKYGTLQEAEQA